MSLIDEAVRLERRAERAYRDAMESTSDPGARRILELLADEEAKHAEILLGTQEADGIRGQDLVQEARGWVQGNVEGGSTSISPDRSLISLLRRGMDVERTTETFYREHAEDAEDAERADLFVRLADREREHFAFLSSLVEYYNRPNEWVEDAEFGLRSEY